MSAIETKSVPSEVLSNPKDPIPFSFSQVMQLLVNQLGEPDDQAPYPLDDPHRFSAVPDLSPEDAQYWQKFLKQNTET